MVKRGLALSLVLAMASIANAGAVVNLDVPDGPVGGYLGGETVQVVVSMTSDVNFDVGMRLQRLDLTGSDAALSFMGPDDNPAGGDGIQEMVLTMGTFDALNALFPNFPAPQFVYNATAPNPVFPPRTLLPGESLEMGTIDVVLPGTPGDYLFDVVNAGADPSDSNLSAAIRYDFNNPVEWRGNSGDISGGQHTFTVVPEPASLALLALGGVAALRRRRAS